MKNRGPGWGIISTGAIAGTFARAVAASGAGWLAGVGSRDAATAQKFATEYGVARACGSYEALLADSAVQAVYIATPHPMHAEWAVRAAQAGKHVLCEKPLTVNHAQAVTVVEAAEKAGVLLMEAFMYRCHPQTAKLVEIIRSGLIGEIHVIKASFGFGSGSVCDPSSRIFSNALAGGGILDVGCYPVSISRLLAGAALGRDFADPLEVHGAGHLGATGVDEWASGLLRFEGGIVAEVGAAVRQTLDNSLRIFGSAGSIFAANPFVCNRREAESTEIVVQLNAGKTTRVVQVKTDSTSFALEAGVFAAAIAAGRKAALPPAMTPADTLGNMKTIDRWRAAIGLEYEMEKM